MNSYRDYDQETLAKLHEVHLELLDEFVRICDENKLTYFLVGGSFLGAVRHHGFIPWDDDIDVGMPRCDYDKFIEIAKDKLDKKYFLDCYDTNKDYYLSYAKIKKNGTIFDEVVSHHLNNHKGIFLDVFPLDNVPKKGLGLKIRAIIAMSISDTMAYKNKVKKLKETLHPCIVFVFNIFGKKFLMNWQRKVVTYCKDDNSLYMCDIGTGYGYRKELLLREHVLPTQKMLFEGKEYNTLHDDTYLKQVYGNYMQLPPEEKRRNHMPLRIEFGDENGNIRKKGIKKTTDGSSRNG